MSRTESRRRVVFRADASREHGTGHVRRCMALAHGFEAIGWRVAFATQKSSIGMVSELVRRKFEIRTIDSRLPASIQADELVKIWLNGVDVVVVDHYGLDCEFERRLRGWARIIVVLDDLANRKHDCDLLFDSAPGRTRADYAKYVPANCRILTGPDYAFTASEFAQCLDAARAKRSHAGLKHIAISLGGADPGLVLQEVLEGLEIAGFTGSVDLILGFEVERIREFIAQRILAYKLQIRTSLNAAEMAKALTHADLAIGAGGSSSWERCCLGLPAIIIITAENQVAIVKGLEKAGAAIVAGWHEVVTRSVIADLLRTLIADASKLSAMSRAASQLCDGRGVQRSVDVILSRLRETA